MSINDVIGRFKTGDYTVRRAAASSYVNGVLVPSEVEVETFTVEACIRPSTGRVRTQQDPHDETAETRKMYCVEELKGRSPGFEPDIVEIDGEDWVVDTVTRSEHWGENHYIALITRLAVP